MANIFKYIPDGKGPFPTVVVFPGFVEKIEKGRSEKIMESLNKKGIAGIGMTYDGIDSEKINGERKLTFNFNLSSYHSYSICNRRKSF